MLIGRVAVSGSLDLRYIPNWTPLSLHRCAIPVQRTISTLHPHHIHITPKPAQFTAPAELHHTDRRPLFRTLYIQFRWSSFIIPRFRSIRRGKLNPELGPAVRAGTAGTGYGCGCEVESSTTPRSVEAQRRKSGINLDKAFY